jgi:DNA polymerase-3 subunit gamma/tau
VPRNGLVRAARHGGHGNGQIDGGCTAFHPWQARDGRTDLSSTVPHQALYRRWRAQRFSQIVGQEAVVETLRNAVRTERVAHALLFVGPRGTGKTSLARILAKALNCTDLRDGDPCDACTSCVAIREGRAFDLVEIDAASNRGIDAVRDLRDRIHYPPADLRRKVYILDEAHQITRDAWNALLKSLEEPPPFVVFMFASTEPSGFPAAILSRLQRYDVRRLTVPEIEGKLGRILEADERLADPGAIRLIARLAAGGMRDAESMLDQLLSAGGDRIDEGRVRDLLGLADPEAVDRFIDALVRGDAGAGIALLDGLEERGRDARSFLDQVVEAIRAELVAGLAGGAPSGRSPAHLASAARHLAGIDPNRAGVGGLRLQLELALFSSGSFGEPAAAGIAPAVALPTSPPVVPVTPMPAPASAATSPSAVRPDPAPDEASAPTSSGRARSTPIPPAAPGPEASGRPLAEPASPAGASQAADVPADAGGEPVADPTTVSPTSVDVTALAGTSPPTPAPTPSAVGGISALDQFLPSWPAIVARVSQNPANKPLIVACRPVAVDGNVITLGFPEEQAFLKEAAERRKGQLEQGIGESLGRPVAVRCVVANLELVATPPASSDSAFLLAEARRIFADDLAEVEEVS